MCLGWLIILSIYLLIHVIYILFGFTSKQISCILLAVIPYLVGTFYYRSSCQGKNGVFYSFGILIPSVAEKVLVYLLGAFLYDINPSEISNVMKVISKHKTYVKLFANPSALYYLNISFFNWLYVLVSLAGYSPCTNDLSLQARKFGGFIHA